MPIVIGFVTRVTPVTRVTRLRVVYGRKRLDARLGILGRGTGPVHRGVGVGIFAGRVKR